MFMQQEAFWKEWWPMGTHPGVVCFWRTIAMEKNHAGVGEKCKEEGEAGMKCSEMTITPIPHPFYAVWGWEEVEQLEMKKEN